VAGPPGRTRVQLAARADVELGEDLTRVVLDGAGADEQPGADLRVRQPVAGQPGDLGFLGGQFVIPAATGALVRCLPGGPQLAPGPASVYRISVKREPHGAASSYLNRDLRDGTIVDVAAPRGDFVLDDGTGPVLLISAGIGVTPVLSMLYE
jgi:NAD(P)H-flavin reductase